MRLTVCAYQSCTVDCKNHMQILHTDIMKHLIHCPLKKRRVNCNDRDHSAQRKSCCKTDCVFLCDSYIKKTLRKCFLKSHKAGAYFHSRSNAHKLRIFSAQAHHYI